MENLKSKLAKTIFDNDVALARKRLVKNSKSSVCPDVDRQNKLVKAISDNDIPAVRKRLAKNSEFFVRPDVLGSVVGVLSEAATFHGNEEYTHVLFEFLESSAENDPGIQLIIAITRGDVESAESLLVKSVKFEGCAWNGDSPMYRIIFRRTDTRMEMLKMLLKFGLGTVVQNGKVESLLLQFVRQALKNDTDAVEVAKFLINSGISIHPVELERMLQYSVINGNISLTSYLIQKGKQIDCTECLGPNLLHLAIRNGNLEMVDLLLSNGADVNAKDANSKNTALHIAVLNLQENIISLLIHRGASVRQKNQLRQTPLRILNSRKDIGDRCLMLILKEIANLIFQNIKISKYDMDMIQKNPDSSYYINKFRLELDLMANTKFYGSYSYFSLLKKSLDLRKLANLMKNEKIVLKFENAKPKLSYYESDLERIYQDAIQLRDNAEVVESRLNSIFGDYLPFLIIKKVSENLTLQDLPLD